MKNRSPIWLLAAVVLVGGCTHRPPAPTPQQTLTYLASDGLQGRGVRTAGLDAAADYIAAQFKADGLKPLPGEPAYFEPFDFPTATAADPSCSLTLADHALVREQDFRPMSLSADGAFNAGIVFAGFGISGSEEHYDDYADIDVKGKAVLVLRYEPRDKDGIGLFSHTKGYSQHAYFVAKAKNAQEHGAAAMIVVDPTIKAPLPFSFGSSDGVSIPVVTITPVMANVLLRQAGLSEIAELKKAIDTSRKPASMLLPNVTAAGKVLLTHEVAHVKNVAAVLPGKGPLAGEFIVVGAHYDHLGIGKGKSPEIFHGADDNASGTTAMLEIAHRMSAGTPPARSVIFIAFSAEEEGLIGSDHFVKHPPVPLDKIAAMLNLDMVGRVRNDTLYFGGAGTAAAFHDLIKDVANGSPLTLKSMGEGGLGPSDHMSFAEKKIPVLFLFSGLHVDYHRPTDTADKINYTGIDQVAVLGEKIANDLAKLPRQTYISSADASQENVSIGFDGPPQRRVTLGVVPDYTSGDVTGVRISDTSPDSPAAKAGLLGGDIVMKLGDTMIESLEGLSAALQTAEAGKPTTVTVLRAGKRIEFPVTLVEKKEP